MASAPDRPDPTTRFSHRVDDYRKFRPDYPPEVMEALRQHTRLLPDAAVADVGSGTGIFTRHLLGAGWHVYAVEPNAPMRIAAEQALAPFAGLRSMDGTAEDTGLPDASVDLVACAQAFHWFDADAARAEFRRILKPGGQVALLWNQRLLDASPFLTGYEALLKQHATDYHLVRHDGLTPEVFQRFYATHVTVTLDNHQDLDAAALRGRLLSSSFAPGPDHPRHGPMLLALDRLFAQTQHQGVVRMAYRTTLRVGVPAV